MMVRIMIVVLLLGSAVLGWLAWENSAEIKRYEEALRPNGVVEKTVEQIQKNAFLYTQYKERAAIEGIKGDGGDDSIAGYVRGQAQDSHVLWGGVSVGAGKPKDTKIDKKTYLDTRYRVEAQEKDRAYSRNQIANFFYLLERDSLKMKITDLTIKSSGKTQAHEIPQDQYDVDFTVTVRTRKESKR